GSVSALAQSPTKAFVDERNVRAEMNFLASDAMQGRGSGSQFERVAAEYIGSQFMQFGLEPAGENGWDAKPTYVQTVTVPGRDALTDFKVEGATVDARELLVLGISGREIAGRIQRLSQGQSASKDTIVLLTVDPDSRFGDLQAALGKLRQ